MEHWLLAKEVIAKYKNKVLDVKKNSTACKVTNGNHLEEYGIFHEGRIRLTSNTRATLIVISFNRISR